MVRTKPREKGSTIGLERRAFGWPIARRTAHDRGAFAALAQYSQDDRQALGLLMLPFLLVAVAIGSSQSLRMRPSYEAPVTLPVEQARNQSALTPGPANEAALTEKSVSQLRALSPSPSEPPVVSPVISPVLAAVPASPLIDTAGLAVVIPPAPVTAIAPLALPSVTVQPAAPDTQIALAPDAPIVAGNSSASPTIAESSGLEAAARQLNAVPAPQTLAPSLPDQIAELPGAADLRLPGSITAPAPLTVPANVCVAETPKPRAASPQRLAALGGQTAGGFVEPIAFGLELAAAAREQLDDFTVYTDKYQTMAYPNGDLPNFYGVCTDVIIRAYRVLGIDLQQLVHQSKLGSGDTNIDHRRVSTLQKYFSAYGVSLPITEFSEDYWPGDVVSYYRPQNAHSRTHIAIVSDVVGPSGNFMIIHNRGWGPQQEDGLFVDQITGHYRYSAAKRPNAPAQTIAKTKPGAKIVAPAKKTVPATGPAAGAGARASLAVPKTGVSTVPR